MCQCELGAVWANTLKHIPILVPPLTYNDLEYILRNQQSMIINDEKSLILFYEEVIEWFKLPPLKASIWKLKSDKFLGNVDGILKKKVCTITYSRCFSHYILSRLFYKINQIFITAILCSA